jgi:hypothetical protein
MKNTLTKQQQQQQYQYQPAGMMQHQQHSPSNIVMIAPPNQQPQPAVQYQQQ